MFTLGADAFFFHGGLELFDGPGGVVNVRPVQCTVAHVDTLLVQVPLSVERCHGPRCGRGHRLQKDDG